MRSDLKIILNGFSSQYRFQLLNISFSKSQSIQFGEFCVRWNPWEFCFEPAKGRRQNSHPGPFTCICSISLHWKLLLTSTIFIPGKDPRISITENPTKSLSLQLPKSSSKSSSKISQLVDEDLFLRGIFPDHWATVHDHHLIFWEGRSLWEMDFGIFTPSRHIISFPTEKSLLKISVIS